MTNVTVELNAAVVRALKARTGERTASAALKAWIASANPRRTSAQLRAAVTQSMKEQIAGKGRRFTSGREAVKWLEPISNRLSSAIAVRL